MEADTDAVQFSSWIAKENMTGHLSLPYAHNIYLEAESPMRTRIPKIPSRSIGLKMVPMEGNEGSVRLGKWSLVRLKCQFNKLYLHICTVDSPVLASSSRLPFLVDQWNLGSIGIWLRENIVQYSVFVRRVSERRISMQYMEVKEMKDSKSYCRTSNL